MKIGVAEEYYPNTNNFVRRNPTRDVSLKLQFQLQREKGGTGYESFVNPDLKTKHVLLQM